MLSSSLSFVVVRIIYCNVFWKAVKIFENFVSIASFSWFYISISKYFEKIWENANWSIIYFYILVSILKTGIYNIIFLVHSYISFCVFKKKTIFQTVIQDLCWLQAVIINCLFHKRDWNIIWNTCLTCRWILSCIFSRVFGKDFRFKGMGLEVNFFLVEEGCGWMLGDSEFILCRSLIKMIESEYINKRINKKDLVSFFRFSFLRMVAKYLPNLSAILLRLFLPIDSS